VLLKGLVLALNRGAIRPIFEGDTPLLKLTPFSWLNIEPIAGVLLMNWEKLRDSLISIRSFDVKLRSA
jgi:hypothetical protein